MIDIFLIGKESITELSLQIFKGYKKVVNSLFNRIYVVTKKCYTFFINSIFFFIRTVTIIIIECFTQNFLEKRILFI